MNSDQEIPSLFEHEQRERKKHTLAVIGAIVGIAGAQIITLAIFAIASSPCEYCEGIPGCEPCFASWTMAEYWARYGVPAGAILGILGGLIGEFAE